MSDWIDVDKEMPLFDVIVLLWTEEDREVVFGKRVSYSVNKAGEHFVSWQQLTGQQGFNPVHAVTHWMPLPKEPITNN